MRPEVQLFVADGPLPDWDGSEEEIDRRCQQLEEIPRPVTAEEAAALAACFGPDDCYGVAWTLLRNSRGYFLGAAMVDVPFMSPI
ncbi:hypothetical protein ACFWJM_04590 [Streptomyces sp. NPDC127077]|uniref:hypothetical protein n=1 Tax=Streptomyces sp. NPDC127077 TaxID=3347131 RepID=UPI00364F47D3